MIHMEYYLIVSAIMFFAGIYGFFTRRNTLAILISIELILNATDINFAVFNRFLFPDGLEGYFFALFSIAISALDKYGIYNSNPAPPLALLPHVGDWRQMDDAPDGRHHRYHGIGCGSPTELCHCLAIFLRSTSGGWYLRHTYAL